MARKKYSTTFRLPVKLRQNLALFWGGSPGKLTVTIRGPYYIEMDPAVEIALCPNCHRRGFVGGECQACGYKPFEPTAEQAVPSAERGDSRQVCPRCRHETALQLAALVSDPEWTASEGKRQVSIGVNLNSLFAPPPPPQEVTMSLILPILVACGSGLVGWVLLQVLASAISARAKQNELIQVTLFALALGAVVGTFLVIWQKQAKRSAALYADEMTVFRHAYRVWEGLYFCPDCVCVADLDRGLSVDAKEIRRLRA